LDKNSGSSIRILVEKTGGGVGHGGYGIQTDKWKEPANYGQVSGGGG